MDTAITRAEHEEFKHRLEEHNARQDKRIELLEDDIKETNALLTSIEKLALNVENMQKELNRQGERLEAIESRDGELWRAVVKYAVTAIVGAAVGFVLTKIGVSI